MNTKFFSDHTPAILIGLADHLVSGIQPFPVGSIDLFNLSQNKVHLIFPTSINKYVWVLLLNIKFLHVCDVNDWRIIIEDEDGIEVSKLIFSGASNTNADTKSTSLENNDDDFSDNKQIAIQYLSQEEYTLMCFQTDGLVYHPGSYKMYSFYNGLKQLVGTVIFHYNKSLPFTPDQVKAIDSDPYSAKVVHMDLGCKKCKKTLRTYSGLRRHYKLEESGVVWQTDLPERFICDCGKANYSLTYIKESLHALLLTDLYRSSTELGYIRNYGHSQVVNVARKFNLLLDKELLEQPIQKFIEDNPILLARFHAKRLFIRPTIIGKFQADFALLDSRNQLIFIELEKPSIQLFTKNGHPTSALLHAYNQVNDWLHQYSKFSGAVLSTLGLSENEVVNVKGAVIAGRNAPGSQKFLQRHLFNSPYPNIEFMTIDDLTSSLLEISRKLV